MGTFHRLAPTVALVASAGALVFAGCGPAADRATQRDITVLLLEYKGPQAHESAERLAGELRAQGLSETFVVKGAEYAAVCVGRYPSWKDPAADAMLLRMRRTRDARGQYPFAGVMLVPVPEPPPPNPWPLEQANGIFSLHVASWEAPGRMVKAQEYARELRRQGYEAYVYHGPRLSMVTIGAFGTNIFDDPRKVGMPGETPRIVDPKVLHLMKAFPRMRLEGELTPPEAHISSYLVKVPGKEPQVEPRVPLPLELFRVTISMVDTRTGFAEGRHEATGVAQSRMELPALIGRLVRQLMVSMKAPTPPRVGAADVVADAGAGVDTVAQEALDAALKTAGVGKIRLFSQEGTRRLLLAQGLTAERIAASPTLLKGVEGLDYVVVTTVLREGQRLPSAPPAPSTSGAIVP